MVAPIVAGWSDPIPFGIFGIMSFLCCIATQFLDFEVKEDESWGKISGKYIINRDDIKIGMNVVLVPERRTIFHKVWRMVKSYFGLKF